VRNVEDKLNLKLSQNYYQLLYSNHFEFLLQNLECLSSCTLLVMSLFLFLFLFFFYRGILYLSSQIKNSDLDCIDALKEHIIPL
jgi:hypothetical protein